MPDDVQGMGLYPEPPPSLRELLEQRIVAERDARLAAWVAHGEVHKHEEEARARASDQMQEWKEHVNAVREQIEQERVHLVGREYYDAQHADLKGQIEKIGDRVGQVENRLANYDGRLLMLGLGLTVLSLVIAVASRIWKV